MKWIYITLIGLILVAGCTGCVKNECKKLITPSDMNKQSLMIVDNEGNQYKAKDIYVFNQMSIGSQKMVTYIDGNPKLLVTVY